MTSTSTGLHKIEQNWYPDRLTADCTCGAGTELVGNDEAARGMLCDWLREHRKNGVRS